MSGPAARLAIIGSRGRMGRALTHLIGGEFASRCSLHASIHSSSAPADWLQAFSCDLWIDFSLPAGIRGIAAAFDAARAQGTSTPPPALVIGATGHDAAERAILQGLSARTLVLQASNFSIGVLVLRKALEFASPMLWDSGFRPQMIETHHVHKKDAPSGTALTLAASTHGLGSERIQSVRAGEVVGDHEITFHGPGEQVTLAHRALSREIFARGALEAALWLAEKRARTPGAAGVVSLDDFFEEKLRRN